MASREDPKAYSQAASELNAVDGEELRTQVLASLPWEEPPFCWLTNDQKQQFRTQAEVCRYGLGEKIWNQENCGFLFLLVAGKVRVRDEDTSKPLATLQPGDWFGDILSLSVNCKAVAASKNAIAVQWNAQLWEKVTNPQLQEFWSHMEAEIGVANTNVSQLPATINPWEKTSTTTNGLDKGNGSVVNSDPPQNLVNRSLTGIRDTASQVSDTTNPPSPPSAIPVPNYSLYPFITSMNAGAACLAMVAQYLQNPVNLEWVQRQLRGQSPKHLVEGAEKLGFILRKLKVEWTDLRQLSFPALLQWQDAPNRPGNWVVAYALKGNSLVIANPYNPQQGVETLPQQTILSKWNGELWQVEVTSKQEKFHLGWFAPAVWKYRGLLAEVLLASFTLQLLGLTTPLITQVIIDKVMVQESLATLDVMAIALLSVAIFEALLGILRLFIFTHTARRLDLSLSAQLFRHLMRLPLAYFESRRVGDTVARVQELEQIRQFLTGTALTVILDSIFAVVYLGLMFYYSIPLTFVGLAVLPLFATLTLIATPILRNWLNETFNRSADSQSFLVETITGIHSVKAHAAEPVARDRWEGLFARFIRTGFKASTTSNISSNIGDFLTNFSNLLILWFGAKLVIEQKLTVGQLVAFQMLSGRVTGPLLRLVQLWQNLQQVLLSVDRIGDILNVAPEAEPGTGLVLPPLKGQVTFEQVFFRYRPNTEPVLKGISFDVQPGQFVGIVGRSGSGKSTLSKLLQRLYTIESGRILIDGFDIKSADIASLRQQIAVVLQEDFLFNSTILENISLGHPDISAEQVVEAARLAAAHDFISDLVNGYETNVGERGTALSGGQRQRIALARLFLSQAPILILDEATSALDSETEQQVLQNLKSVSSGRTVFLIAHRFAPLKRADLILVMEKGVIAERGTHEELLRQKGLYWSLYQRQQANI